MNGNDNDPSEYLYGESGFPGSGNVINTPIGETIPGFAADPAAARP